ncbi:hypothetical protein vseg_017741 [Gypsophila vaccaria]
MARKSNLHKQRELNLRGRSIARQDPVTKVSANALATGNAEKRTMTGDTNHGPTENSQSKMKNINDIVGIMELQVESDDETAEEHCRDEEEKQSVPQENRVENESSGNTEEEGLDDSLLQLEEDDVIDELEYWKNAVICFIMGANPPGHVIEGFIRRIWTKFNIDKISFLPNGVFLVRFASLEMKEKALNSGYFLFDNKPLIV